MSAATLPAELEIQTPLHCTEKRDIALFGPAMVTVIPDTFSIFKAPRQQEAMSKYTD